MLLCATELRCVRGGREVFSGLAFSVVGGRALAITGRNGSGKSSLLRVVAGLVRPAGGALSLEGGAAELSIGEQAHYLGHLDALKPSLSVGENLRFWIDYLGGAGTTEALSAVGLGALEDLPAAYLSAGQKRRLSLARLIAVERPIWLLDEPTASLDASAQELLTSLMRSHLGKGGLILAATHGPLGLDDAQELHLGEHGS